jgi:hypothetical protein
MRDLVILSLVSRAKIVLQNVYDRSTSANRRNCVARRAWARTFRERRWDEFVKKSTSVRSSPLQALPMPDGPQPPMTGEERKYGGPNKFALDNGQNGSEQNKNCHHGPRDQPVQRRRAVEDWVEDAESPVALPFLFWSPAPAIPKTAARHNGKATVRLADAARPSTPLRPISSMADRICENSFVAVQMGDVARAVRRSEGRQALGVRHGTAGSLIARL